ncbi:CpsD/CapB family tyrosine-protein kinase [Roseobacteraceae bacterium S113]
MMVDKRWIKRDAQPAAAPQQAPAQATGLNGHPDPAVHSGAPRRRPQDAYWDMLDTFPVDEAHLEKNRIITATRRDPSHAAFDVLRTKLLRTLRDNGWSRVAITSPTEGCGKTFVAANLTLSLSRQLNCRSMLMDFDMRRPSVGKVLGIQDAESMGDFLRGQIEPHDIFRRAGQNMLKIGNNIAVAANGIREDFASELLQDPTTADILDDLEEELAPDVMIFDMPPALVNDDVLAARPLYDGVLVVVGGGITKPQDVREVERRLGDETPLLGIVLNKSEGVNAKAYSY